jgi:hypothetical protein
MLVPVSVDTERNQKALPMAGESGHDRLMGEDEPTTEPAAGTASEDGLARRIAADAAFAFLFALIVTLILASLAATVGVSMTLAIGLLLGAWIVAMALTFVMAPVWRPRAKDRIAIGVMLLGLLGLLGWYEQTHLQAPLTADAIAQRVVASFRKLPTQTSGSAAPPATSPAPAQPSARPVPKKVPAPVTAPVPDPARVVVADLKFTPTAGNGGRQLFLSVQNKGPGVAYGGSVETRTRPSQVAFSDSEIAIHENVVLDRARVAVIKKNSIEAHDPATYIISGKPIPEEVWGFISQGKLKFYVFTAFPYIDDAARKNEVKIATYSGYYTSDSNGGVMFVVLSNLTGTYTILPGAAASSPSPSGTELGTSR